MSSRSLLGVFVLGLAVFSGGCAGTGQKPAETQPPSFSVEVESPNPVGEKVKCETNPLEKEWGIRVESARLSAEGYMIDFRFRVLDAAKATQIFDRRIMPYIIDQATGARFVVPSPPKIGQLRSGGNIKEDRVYFIFFANPARYVKSGTKITVVVGDFEIQDIVVDAVDSG